MTQEATIPAQSDDLERDFEDVLGELNGKQARFVREYVFGRAAGNAVQSAIRAGYSEKSSHSQGSRLLDHAGVARAIGIGQRMLAARNDVSADAVVRAWAAIAFADIRKLAEWDGDGSVSFTPSSELSDDEVAMVATITKETKTFGRDTTVERVELKLHDRMKALDSLARYLGMFNDKLTLTFGKVEQAVREEARAAGLSEDEADNAVRVAKQHLGIKD